MTTTRILPTTLMLAVLVAAPLRAEPMGPPRMAPPMMHGDSPAMMLHMILRQADLTPEQQDRVHKIMESDHQALRSLFQQLQDANDQLADKLFAPGTVELADLTPQVQEVTQLRQQLMEQGLKTALAIRSVLTPQQLARVAQIKSQIEKLQAEMRNLLKDGD